MVYNNIQGSLANIKSNNDLVSLIDLYKMLTDKYGLDEKIYYQIDKEGNRQVYKALSKGFEIGDTKPKNIDKI